jgi:hypothetical protein
MTSQRRHSPARLRAIVARAVPVAACGILAAACGSTVAPASNSASAPAAQAGTQSPAPSPSPTATGGSGSTGTGTPGSTAPSQVNISITVTGANARHWTLRCEPPSGNVPDPQTACERLLGQPALFNPSPHHVMCPQMMADAPGYLVSGTFLGQHIHRAIMDGGCDLGKWSILHEIFQ